MSAVYLNPTSLCICFSHPRCFKSSITHNLSRTPLANAACSGNNENFCKEFPIAQGLEWGLGLGIYGAFKAGKLPFGMQEYMDGYFGKGATLGVAASRKKAAEAKQGRK